MYKEYPVVLFTLILAATGCASSDTQSHNRRDVEKSVEDVIPVTMANMRGHEALYDEGWFVITSSEKALSYAKEKSVISSREAVTLAAGSIAQRDDALADELSRHWKLSADIGKQTFQAGTRITRNMFDETSHITALQLDYSKASFEKSWAHLIRGNLHLGRRTQETRAGLAAQPGDYFQNLSDDFSNIYEITAKIQQDASLHIGTTWSNAFGEAAASFNQEYEKSGQSANAIGGLAHIISAYAKGLYQGLFRPTATTVADTASAGARGAAQLVFLPAATAISVSGRTIQAIGTTVYYTGRLGVEIISPTVEAGLLSGMAVLSLGTASLSYVTGTVIGAVNQVAFTAAAPVAGAGSGVALTAADAGKYVVFVGYDAVAGTSKVVINQASAAVVLGYNALTALPAHAFMGVIDSAVFLAYDGPRLVIAYTKGEIAGEDGESLRIDSLPVGSVVDLNALEREGVEVNVLSDDPAVIRKVMEKLPDDLRE